MANIPSKAVKKIKNDVHREIAAGILIAYGLFPRTNEGIAAAQRLIAGRETWLAPSDLPNYYDNIESDLMTGKETAGIMNIRMLLKEFYGLNDTKPKSQPKLKPAKPKVNNNPTKKEPETGETTIYKPEDKFVDDITENLDKKLEETSNEIMDVVDALIEKQKKDFEEFKRKQEEDRKRRQEGENQYPTPIGPDPIQGPVEPPVQGPKEPPKKTVAPEKDEDWESEVPDQLGTKLDELIEQVKQDPLPQPEKTKRRRTKGKKKLGRKMPKINGSEMGLSESLSEIYQNVIETREALFKLYKINKERFEFKKSADARLSQLLQGKAREAALEREPTEETDGKGKKKDKDKKKKEKKKKGLFSQVLSNTFFAGLIAALTPVVINAVRPFMQSDQSVEPPAEAPPEGEEPVEPTPAAPETAPEQPVEPTPAAPEPAPPPTPLPDTSIPGDYDYKEPSLFPLKAAADGGEFIKGDKKPLAPITVAETKNPLVKKLTKPLMDVVSLPQKAGAISLLSLANNVLSPFGPFIPDAGRQFVNNIFSSIAKSAGIPNFKVELKQSESIFDSIMKMFGMNNNTTSPGNGGGGGGGGGGSRADLPVGDDLKSFIGGLESGNDYTKLVGGAKDSSILDKTVSQLMSEKGGKFAMGRYQIQMNSAMDMLKARGIDPKTFKFDQAGQDQLFDMLADRRGYQDYKSGKITKEQFAHNLSKEWAALPTDATGRGFYDGVGTNKSLTTWDKTLKAIEKDKNAEEKGVEPAPPPSQGTPLVPQAGNDIKPPQKDAPPIEKQQTFADRVLNIMGLGQPTPPAPPPQQNNQMSDIFKMPPNSASSASSTSKRSSSQPGF